MASHLSTLPSCATTRTLSVVIRTTTSTSPRYRSSSVRRIPSKAPCKAPCVYIRRQSSTTNSSSSTTSSSTSSQFDDIIASSKPPTQKEQTSQEKASIVFGSRLSGPAERRRELDTASTRIAGVLVPPRPEEPDNCCMSGCVNCVWDRYRDEIEEWAAKSAEAKAAVEAQRNASLSAGQQQGVSQSAQRSGERSGEVRGSQSAITESYGASSMDDDGGGSEALWASPSSSKPDENLDLFDGVPVGILEFMRTEKRLKEKKREKIKSGEQG